MTRQDGKSFEVIFRKHFSDIYGYVAFRLAPDLHDAQDLTQDVFVAGFKAWGSFRGETTPLQWLRSIARRKVADHFRRQRPGVAMEAISLSAEMESDSSATEQVEMLSAVLRSIPPKCTELLEEKYLEGLSLRKMASRHGKTEKAIESALSRARTLVRHKIHQLQTQGEIK